MQTQTESESKPETDESQTPQANGTFTFPSSTELKDLLKFVLNLTCEEATFELDQEGLRLRLMDPSRVSLTILQLPKHTFEEFLCVQPGTFTINVESTLKEILKRVKKNETVKVDVTDERLIFLLKQRLKRLFRQPIVEQPEDYEKVPEPKVRHTARVKVVTQSFKEITEDLGEFCTMTVEQDRITFSDRPEDKVIDLSVTLEKGDDSLLSLELVQQPFKSKYSASYLREFAGHVSKLSEVLTLQLAKDMPLKFECDIRNGGRLEYWLAPRIEAE